MNATTVNEFNAYAYSDNYAVLNASGDCVGCEHNKEEADALARYLSEYHGKTYTVRANGHDAVRSAKRFRKEPLRFKDREYVFRKVGLWK